MTSPSEDLLSLATPYALDAVDQAERADIEHRVRTAHDEISGAFAVEVRQVREAMAAVSAVTAVEPPPQLRERLLAAVTADQPPQVRQLRPSRRRWTTAAVAAAAAVVIGVGTFGVGWFLRPATPVTTAEQVFAAPDVQTVSGPIPTGGTATVVFSRDRNAGVLVMNDVAPPEPGTVYQMWLIDTEGAHSAGVMDGGAVTPSTTAVLPDLGASTTLAFTVEPGAGSESPTSTPFATLSLT